MKEGTSTILSSGRTWLLHPHPLPSQLQHLIRSPSSAYDGALQKFQEKFNTTLLGLNSSGLGWSVQDVESNALEITTSKDEDIVPAGKEATVGVLTCGSMRIICSI